MAEKIQALRELTQVHLARSGAASSCAEDFRSPVSDSFHDIMVLIELGLFKTRRVQRIRLKVVEYTVL